MPVNPCVKINPCGVTPNTNDLHGTAAAKTEFHAHSRRDRPVFAYGDVLPLRQRNAFVFKSAHDIPGVIPPRAVLKKLPLVKILPLAVDRKPTLLSKIVANWPPLPISMRKKSFSKHDVVAVIVPSSFIAVFVAR